MDLRLFLALSQALVVEVEVTIQRRAFLAALEAVVEQEPSTLAGEVF
jgi:hypothetical protein